MRSDTNEAEEAESKIPRASTNEPLGASINNLHVISKAVTT